MVTFLRSGLTVPWDARFGSLLELSEACAVPVRWSCRSGACHSCESGLIEGELAYAPEPLDPPAEGNALICCSTPKTPSSSISSWITYVTLSLIEIGRGWCLQICETSEQNGLDSENLHLALLR
jgi:ferredoxin